MNIRELRAELKRWGMFWASKESLQAYASTSVTERCCEVMRTGVWISSEKHLFSHHSESIYVPEHISAIDKIIRPLPVPQKAAINRRYIKNANLEPTQKLALLHAETYLLSCNLSVK